MTQKRKTILVAGSVGGIVFAGLMAGFDYFEGLNFRPLRFFINFMFMGAFLGFLTHYNIKKQSKKENQSK